MREGEEGRGEEGGEVEKVGEEEDKEEGEGEEEEEEEEEEVRKRRVSIGEIFKVLSCRMGWRGREGELS